MTAGNPFFRSLPNLRQHLIYATNDTHVRMATIRKALRHLGEGGSLLIFPSGKVDPDPNYFLSEARLSLDRWSDSLELLLRAAARLVVAINSGFCGPPRISAHPFAGCIREAGPVSILPNLSRLSSGVSPIRSYPTSPKYSSSEPFSLEELAQFPPVLPGESPVRGMQYE